MKWLVALCISLAMSLALAWTAAEEERFQVLTNELRCLVCQNQSIADSNAPLAEDLRRQVREMMEDGKTDDEIREYMTARYGDFVLYRPPLKSTTWMLWFGPFILLTLGALIIWGVRRRRVPEAPAVDSEALRRLLEEQAEEGKGR